MYYYLILLAALTAFVTVVYRYRAHIFPHLPNRLRGLKHYTPLATFQEQANAGLSSSAFDIEANIRDGDSRAGLDEQGTREVMEIMARERVNFDQARLIRHNEILAKNGIDPSGMPTDSKTVTFANLR